MTTVRVMPWPASARALERRAVRITPASAAIVPVSTNRRSLQARDADAGEPGRAGVLADGVDLAADPRPVEDDAEDDGEGHEDDERPRDRRAGHVAEAEAS